MVKILATLIVVVIIAIVLQQVYKAGMKRVAQKRAEELEEDIEY